jgi:ABC-type sugar transport system substrate-binding protein
MKKILALALVLVLAVGLCACGGSGSQTPAATTGGDTQQGSAPAPAANGKAFPNCNADGSINLDTIAHYDAEYDYTQNEKFKVMYISQAGTVLYQQSADAYEHWAPYFNMEWAGFVSADGDSDMFMTQLNNYIDQGVRGFILDPDSTTFPAVLSILEDHPEVAWMSQMSPPRDGEAGDGIPDGGNMINNYVGFDNVDSGRQVTKRLVQWKNETYPDVPWSEVGFLMFDYSVSPALHERSIGSKEVFLDAGGSEDMFFTADCVSTGFSMQGGLDAAGPIISSHPEIKYWLCNGLFDDLAQAGASLFDQQGLTDNCAVGVFGGSALIQQWDAGQQDSFRFAVYTAQTLYAEPIIGAVYAYLMGWATPDSIWPSWINNHDHGVDGHTYSQLRLPTVSLEYDDYKHYLKWTDMYTKADVYKDYPSDGITIDDFSPFVTEVPPEYK